VSAQLYGIIMAHTLDNEGFDSGISELLSSLTGKVGSISNFLLTRDHSSYINPFVAQNDIDTKHGGLLTLGHGLERKILLMRQNKQLDSLNNWTIYKKSVCTVGKLVY
jgi:hypothetical protein